MKGGRVLEDLIDSTDFLPTVLQASGEPMPGDVKLDGQSFLPQLRGEHVEDVNRLLLARPSAWLG